MFHRNPSGEAPTFSQEHARTDADVKRMIAGNLETVEWIDWSMIQKQGGRCSSRSAHLNTWYPLSIVTASYPCMFTSCSLP